MYHAYDDEPEDVFILAFRPGAIEKRVEFALHERLKMGQHGLKVALKSWSRFTPPRAGKSSDIYKNALGWVNVPVRVSVDRLPAVNDLVGVPWLYRQTRRERLAMAH